MSEKKIYFGGLNGIRFFAASLVILSHLESFKAKDDLPHISYFFFLGTHGVNIFFVLSGFLITFLILSEIEKKGKVSVRKFYLRRILRIWPLYFVILGLGYFVLPHVFYPTYFPKPDEDYFFIKMAMNILFLPNLVLLIFGSYFATGVLWSIGVEEQFYLFWPLILNKFRTTKVIGVALGVIIGLKFVLIFLLNLTYFSTFHEVVSIILNFLKHDLILVGAFFGAIFFEKRQRVIEILFNRFVLSTAVLCILALIFVEFKIGVYNYGLFSIIYAFCYAVIIVNISLNKDFIFKLENAVLNYLGNISYGIYMFHSIVIAVVMKLLHVPLKNGSFSVNAIFYFLVFAISISVASVSYHFFEHPFIKIKSRFMVVKSSGVKE